MEREETLPGSFGKRGKRFQPLARIASAAAILVPLLIAFPTSTHGVVGDSPAPIVIAHRGASGTLPEHTIEAYTYAYASGADYIEPDVTLTKDGVFIALHDRTLESNTDVAKQFPGRAREDGRYYPIDFTLSEIKRLRVYERVQRNTGEPVFPNRWPNRHKFLHFQIATLAEIVELVQGLNQVTGREVGIYPELKNADWHHAQGYLVEELLLKELRQFGYYKKEHKAIIQVFDTASLHRLRALKTELRLIQLIRGSQKDDAMVTSAGLREIAKYADGIGPPITRLFHADGTLIDDNFLVREAHRYGLHVHPYTIRADQLPEFAATVEELLEKIVTQAGVDGFFTDYPGIAVRFLAAQRSGNPTETP